MMHSLQKNKFSLSYDTVNQEKTLMKKYKKTDKLLDILKKSPTIDDYIENETDNLIHMTLSEYLNKILSDKNLKTSDLVKLTGLDRTYTYQIVSGRKTPSRDKVIAICIALNMSFKDTQQLLKATGYPILYARFQRDSIIIFAFQHSASLTDTNELLFDYGFDTLV